ncbi:MAG: hypothetical protein RLN90_01580 [Balneolaceae bacterium]
MIYRVEEITEFEKRLLKNLEPYVEYWYSNEESGTNNNWTVHSRVKNGVHFQQLRAYKLEQIRQGFIATDFESAKSISLYLIDPSFSLKIEEENDWLKSYVTKHGEKSSLKFIAIPISDFIQKYSNNFNMLATVDFKELFNWHNITVPGITDVK